MTVLSDVGRQYLNDYLIGRETTPLDTVAVGVGTAPESFTDTALSNEVYRSSVANNNVRFTTIPPADGGPATLAAIDLQGGLEVPAGTEITEIAVYVSTPETLVYRDVFNPITVASGRERTLQVWMDTGRL